MSSSSSIAGWTVAILLLLAAATAVTGSEDAASPLPSNPRHTGTPFLTVWRPDDYGAQPENYCVVQHPATGLIYVGNGGGVLEFDGARWQLIPSPGAAAVIALAIDGRGRIWGTTGADYFRLEPDTRGRLHARSVADLLPPEIRRRTALARSVVTPEGVWFFNQRNLLCFPVDGAPVRTWTVSEGNVVALRLWEIGGEAHVMIGGNVTLRVRGGRLERVPGLGTTVWDARAEPDGSRRILTAYTTERWDGTTRTELGRLPSGDGAYDATFLGDGRSVFGTGRHGLVVCDEAGRVLQSIGRAHGLPANQIVDVLEDREGGVWAVTRNGIARVQFDSPYTLHGPAQGLEGTIHSLARHGEWLFAGGTEGAARRGADGRFEPVPNFATAVREVVAHEDWLFLLTTRFRGLRPALDREAIELENRNYFGLVSLASRPGWFVHGANEGVRWARFEGGDWRTYGPLAAMKGRAHVLLESPDGFIWAVHAGAVWRIDFRGGVHAGAPARKFGAREGIAAAPNALFWLGGEVVALSGGQLLHFDATAERFGPETRIDGLHSLRVDRVVTGDDGTIWLHDSPPARQISRLVRGNGARWRVEPLPGEPLPRLKPTTLYHDTTTQTLWIGGAGALVARDLTWRPTRPATPPTAIVRRIETDEGELLHAASTAAAQPRPLVFQPKHDALRISFAAPAFAPDRTGLVPTQYRTRLDGFDRGWSAWSREAAREFTNLPWRELTFRVQARDSAGRAGPEASLAFSIQPPWWGTRWAWAGYGVVGLTGIAGLVRLRTRALHLRAARLEAIVHARTHELAESNARLGASNVELSRLHQLELDGKLAAQLAEEKARLEVLRYQLNPHFLYNSLNSIYGLLFENPRGARDMVLRLSDFCRATLTGSKDELPTLETEIAALRTYLDVEQVRWNDRLQVEFAVAPETARLRLPPFLLLPLIENAIKYGSRTSPGVLRVRIRTRLAAQSARRRAERRLIIEVANTGQWLPPDESRPEFTGIGLENLRQRLQRYYPHAHDFTTETKDGWVIVRLQIARRLRLSAPRPASRVPASTA